MEAHYISIMLLSCSSPLMEPKLLFSKRLRFACVELVLTLINK